MIGLKKKSRTNDIKHHIVSVKAHKDNQRLEIVFDMLRAM